MRHLLRSFAAALAGGLIGVAILAAAYARNPGLTFEMNAALPDYVSGVHGAERDGSVSFAWTTGRVAIDLGRLNRKAPWSCSLRFRAFRPDGASMPTVTVLVDGAQAASVPASSDFVDLGFSIPASPRGPQLAFDVAPTFTPGTADTRVLGIQIDRLQCTPAAFAWPPSSAMMHVGVAAGFAGLVFLLFGISFIGALAGAAAAAAGASLLLTTGGAMYSGYSNTLLRIVLWTVAIAAGLASVAQQLSRVRLTSEARAAVAVSAIALLVKLIGLMHPAKPVIDALFHAHRLDWVVGGKYFFTQPFVGGVEMPYAIGLYVFAWPWAGLVADHVALIRTVTAASDAVAALLLYPLVARALGDRRAAVFAVLFYHLAPLPFAVLGNANLTNMFGQSLAIVVMVAAVLWKLSPYRPVSLVGFTALVTWAFCSHVSTLTMLLATLGALAVLYVWRGDRSRREAAAAIAIAACAALAVSWLIYYRHFGDEVSAAFARMFSGGTSAMPATPEEAARGYMGVADRVKHAAIQAGSNAGWPIVILAIVGAWSLWKRREWDRLSAALVAWAALWIVFSASTVFSRVDQEFVRYATEFLGRINLAVLPMVAILAGRGAAVAGGFRAVSVVLIAWAVLVASQSLVGWFDR